MLLMIDNYDSFTYNLVQYFLELHESVKVLRNDEVAFNDLSRIPFDKIVISPGPCTPRESGLSLKIIAKFADKVPILGVCLGHQCIAEVFGGKIIHAKEVVHGKVSKIYHDNTGVLSTLPQGFLATRYHSLVVDKANLPRDFHVTAWTGGQQDYDEVMAIRHKTLPLEGVQFHPEAILTEHGHKLLDNFLRRANEFHTANY